MKFLYLPVSVSTVSFEFGIKVTKNFIAHPTQPKTAAINIYSTKNQKQINIWSEWATLIFISFTTSLENCYQFQLFAQI